MIIVARIRKPQGIRGELLVDVLTDDPETIFAPGRQLFVGDARGDHDSSRGPVTITRARSFKDGYILALEEIADRTAAEKWRGRHLLVNAHDLAPLEGDEIYRHELIGMRVVDEREGEIGAVMHVYDMPSGLMLEVSRGERTVLVPYTTGIVTEVDTEARVVHVATPEGLLE